MMYAIEMTSGGMKIGTGVQTIGRFCLRNLNGCNVGIREGRDLRNAP
jgi:hypothetical protein